MQRINDKKQAKKAKRCLKKHMKAMCELKIAVVSGIISHLIEELKVTKLFPFGRLWIVLAGMHRMYRGVSMLDHVQLDRDKLMIKMTNNEHPDKLFERTFAVRKQYAHRENGIQPTMPQLIACVINGSSADYKAAFTTKLLAMKGKKDHNKIVEELKEMGNELHTTLHKNKDDGSSSLMDGETGLFSAGEDPYKVRDRWLENAECY